MKTDIFGVDTSLLGDAAHWPETAFYDCGVVELSIPEGIKTIDIGRCPNLRRLHLPKTVTKAKWGDHPLLDEVTVAEGSPMVVNKDGLLYADKKLIFIPEHFKTVGVSGTDATGHLQSVKLGSQNRYLDNIFLYCPNVPMVEKPDYEGSKELYDAMCKKLNVWVLPGMLNQYRESYMWNVFQHIQEMTPQQAAMGPDGLVGIKQPALYDSQKEALFDISGRKLHKLQSGITIQKTSDGKTRKIIIR